MDQGSVISLPEVSEGYINIDGIEGNTLVNYCTDGAKELTLNGDIDVEGTSVTTTEGVDNGLVDVALEGNTLVNIVKQYRYGFTNASRVDDQYVKLQHGTDENSCNITMPYGVCMYKPNTTYTLVVDIKENTSTATLGMSPVGSVISKVSSINIGKDPGKYFITFETKDDFSTDCKGVNAPINDIYFCSWDKGGDGSNHIIFRFYILEGDWTNKEIPEYFEGMKSVGQDDENGHKIEILSQSKNLFNGFTEQGNLIGNPPNDSLGEPLTNSCMRRSDFIKVQGNTQYVTGVLNNNGVIVEKVLFFDINKKAIQVQHGGGGVFRTPINCFYVRFVFAWGELSTNTMNQSHIDDSQTYLLKGSTIPSQYVNGAMNNKEILLNEPLRGLPNGVKDRFVKIGGKWFI